MARFQLADGRVANVPDEELEQFLSAADSSGMKYEPMHDGAGMTAGPAQPELEGPGGTEQLAPHDQLHEFKLSDGRTARVPESERAEFEQHAKAQGLTFAPAGQPPKSATGSDWLDGLLYPEGVEASRANEAANLKGAAQQYQDRFSDPSREYAALLGDTFAPALQTSVVGGGAQAGLDRYAETGDLGDAALSAGTSLAVGGALKGAGALGRLAAGTKAPAVQRAGGELGQKVSELAPDELAQMRTALSGATDDLPGGNWQSSQQAEMLSAIEAELANRGGAGQWSGGAPALGARIADSSGAQAAGRWLGKGAGAAAASGVAAPFAGAMGPLAPAVVPAAMALGGDYGGRAGERMLPAAIRGAGNMAGSAGRALAPVPLGDVAGPVGVAAADYLDDEDDPMGQLALKRSLVGR